MFHLPTLFVRRRATPARGDRAHQPGPQLRPSGFTDRAARLLDLASPPRWAAAAIVGLGLLSALLEGAGLYLFIPLLHQLGPAAAGDSVLTARLDGILAAIDPSWRITVLVAGIFLTILLKNLVGQLNHFVTQYVNGVVTHRLRTRMARQTVDTCIDYRVESRRTDIATTISTHSYAVGSALLQLYHMTVAACTIGVFVLLLVVISPVMTVLALAFYAVGAGAVQVLMRHAGAVGQQVVAYNKAFGMRMWDTIMGLRLIRSCARESYEMDRFEAASDDVRRRVLRMNMLWGIPRPVSEVGAALLIALLILAGARLELGIPALAAFLAVLYRMQQPVRGLLSARVSFDSEWPAAVDVARFVEATREPYITSGEIPFGGLREGVELRGVGYRHDRDGPAALQDVSFTIARGRTTAIVGRSGAGKSTLLDLLIRFRDPTSGEILVDGTPLRALEVSSWRERLAIMSQDVHLFNDTVEANIGYGRAGAGPAEIRDAAAVAGAAGFIEALPDGYGTVLGDSGVRLSGGERQRIALARTILRNPDILLLDEPTNALDSESERAFQAALRRYARGRTVIVVAHRLSTIEDADHIVVLEHGRVVESGRPGELRAAAGLYARLHAPSDASTVMPHPHA